MYFSSRGEAGQKLAAQLENYRFENCAVLALNDGGVLVGEQIAARLHCPLMMLLTEEIDVPGEQTLFGTVDQNGGFIYNGMFSTGEIEAYYGEFHGYLEDQKREKYQHINRILGEGGILDEVLLRDHFVIITSDGFPNGASLDAAAEFLKHLRLKKLIVTVPVASVSAVDRMHILADELHVLSVTDNYIDTNHYYEDNHIPSHEETIKRINQIVLSWQ